MSYSNRVASKDSITNQNQGGGSKKAGLPKGIGKDYHFRSFARPIGPHSGRYGGIGTVHCYDGNQNGGNQRNGTELQVGCV